MSIIFLLNPSLLVSFICCLLSISTVESFHSISYQFFPSVKESSSFEFHLQVKVTKSEEEWRQQLSPAAYNVLRREGTEPPFSSDLNNVKQEGTFVCAGCKSPLFQYATKYNSGTGWPSFYDPIDAEAIDLKVDYKLIMPRTEVTCSTCGGHLGHVFDDGPKPTGKRYCMNGVAMEFVPEGEDLELLETISKRVSESKLKPGGNTIKSPLESVLPSAGLDAAVALLFLVSFVHDHPLQAIQNANVQTLTLLFPLGVGTFYAFSAVQKILNALD